MFPLAQFRILYPAFSSLSDAIVLATAEQAKCYLSANGCKCDDQGWMLMVAHLLSLRPSTSGGSAPASGQVVSASVGGVSVSYAQAPQGSSSFKHWLNGTPYGQQLLALLGKCSTGGRYYGGLPETRAFRRWRGRSW